MPQPSTHVCFSFDAGSEENAQAFLNLWLAYSELIKHDVDWYLLQSSSEVLERACDLVEANEWFDIGICVRVDGTEVQLEDADGEVQLHALASLLQSYLEMIASDQSTTVEFALTGSRPYLGCYGGGAFVVSASGYEFMDSVEIAEMLGTGKRFFEQDGRVAFERFVAGEMGIVWICRYGVWDAVYKDSAGQEILLAQTSSAVLPAEGKLADARDALREWLEKKKANPPAGLWTEINVKLYSAYLQSSPPAMRIGRVFAVGDCVQMAPSEYGLMHVMCCAVNYRYFSRVAPLSTFNPVTYLEEINKQYFSASRPGG